MTQLDVALEGLPGVVHVAERELVHVREVAREDRGEVVGELLSDA